jgi:hypothetical protein
MEKTYRKTEPDGTLYYRLERDGEMEALIEGRVEGLFGYGSIKTQVVTRYVPIPQNGEGFSETALVSCITTGRNYPEPLESMLPVSGLPKRISDLMLAKGDGWQLMEKSGNPQDSPAASLQKALRNPSPNRRMYE